jgi:hypothetical protein
MERKLAIYQLTPQAVSEGLRMSEVLLPQNVAAQRAKSAVVHFPSDTAEL